MLVVMRLPNVLLNLLRSFEFAYLIYLLFIGVFHMVQSLNLLFWLFLLIELRSLPINDPFTNVFLSRKDITVLIFITTTRIPLELKSFRLIQHHACIFLSFLHYHLYGFLVLGALVIDLFALQFFNSFIWFLNLFGQHLYHLYQLLILVFEILILFVCRWYGCWTHLVCYHLKLV